MERNYKESNVKRAYSFRIFGTRVQIETMSDPGWCYRCDNPSDSCECQEKDDSDYWDLVNDGFEYESDDL